MASLKGTCRSRRIRITGGGAKAPPDLRFCIKRTYLCMITNSQTVKWWQCLIMAHRGHPAPNNSGPSLLPHWSRPPLYRTLILLLHSHSEPHRQTMRPITCCQQLPYPPCSPLTPETHQLPGSDRLLPRYAFQEIKATFPGYAFQRLCYA